MRLVFKLIVILLGVKAAWYFYHGKCSLDRQFGYGKFYIMIGVKANISGNHKP